MTYKYFPSGRAQARETDMRTIKIAINPKEIFFIGNPPLFPSGANESVNFYLKVV